MKSNRSQRKHDIVVWGASGFTGRLVVHYLARRYPPESGIRWAAGGRDAEKLQRVLKECLPAGVEVPVVIANSNDPASLTAMATSTAVVLTTVGPYARYGSNLVAACAASGTHYCDLAGEVQWMRAMIDAYQAKAQSSGARIVHSCGFDSIPSDIGVFLLQRAALKQFGSPCNSVGLMVKAMKGGASGGTVASMLTAIEQARGNREIARILADPYALNPPGERHGPDGRDLAGVKFDQDAGTWTGPFIMAAVNTRIVRRTNALLSYPYGRNFRYREATITGKGPGGWCKSAMITAGLGLFLIASSSDFIRKNVVYRLVPKPGEGPTADERASGYFKLQIYGKTSDGKSLQLAVTGDRDPGYGSTSKMLAESAICLARENLDVAGGVWTPASAMGTQLAERLVANAGLSFAFD